MLDSVPSVSISIDSSQDGLLCSACGSVRRMQARVKPLAYLPHLLHGEAVAGSESRDCLEVVVLSARQGPVEHARRGVADILEAVHYVARDEDDGARTDRGGLVTDGQLIGTLDDEEHLFLAVMNVVRRAFTRFVPRHEHRNGTAGSLSGKQYFHVEAEGLHRQRLFGLDDDGL